MFTTRGLAVTGDIVASGASTFNGPFVVNAIATFVQDLIVQGQVTVNGVLKVLSDVIFQGHVTVGSDSAGIAVIPKSTMSVDVPFERSFDTPPIVTITLVLPQASNSAFLAEGVQAAVTNVTTSGFSIVLNGPVPRDLTYNWFALTVSGGRTIVGKSIDGTGSTSTLLVPPVSDILGVTATSSAIPTLVPTVTVEASASATLSAGGP